MMKTDAGIEEIESRFQDEEDEQ
uniref:Uncharacterized protein n=1 Tax=Arundo donax TaxID=35708 RepID=A0A0A9BJ92_ARUDO